MVRSNKIGFPCSCGTTNTSTSLFSWVLSPGGTLRKIGWGCAARFLKPLPYLWPKSAIFPTLFMTWPKLPYPIYDHRDWHSCPKHNLWRAYINGLIDNDGKVASSKKHTQFKVIRVRNHTLFITRRAKIDPLFVTKTAWGGTSPTETIQREYPPPPRPGPTKQKAIEYQLLC